MARSGSGAKPWLGKSIAATLAALGATLLACLLAAPAPAATGGAASPGGSPAPPTGGGAPDENAEAGDVRLTAAKTSPRKTFYYGIQRPRLRYEIASDEPANDLRVDVVGLNGEVVKSFYRNDVAPGTPDSVRWDGTVAGGKPARNGRYSFRVAPQDGDSASVSVAPRARKQSGIGLSFSIYAFAFPILGAHDYGQGGARFGAGRSGHTHQGQDVMARCGTPLIAARGGRVRFSGYQGAAGNYVVIDGRGTGFDTAYLHLLRPSPLKKGQTVRTGQPIGLVGSTGSSTACHLHFEIWTAPGWYEGGSPIDPLGYLKKWDRYS
ncbi:MAG TPA: peptidoglycan DD-metalloendopeptidase family protein [Solirubrobacterales bacterium]|nr:peptidoglycan DD-metalloendopeptidase family protein [Solirubrobacterales bacterium]